MEIIIYLLSVALLAYGRYRDIQSSKDFIYYGLEEGFAFSRDADGNFNYKKNLIGSGAFLAITTIAAFWAPYPAALANTILGVISFAIAVFHNEKKKRNNRERQIDILTQFRNGDSPSFGGVTTRNGKTFYGLFRWIFVENVDVTDSDQVVAAQRELYGRLRTLAQQDPSTWFPQ